MLESDTGCFVWKTMKHSKKNRVRPADAPCKRPQTSDMYNRAFPVGNALFFFVGSVMSLFRLPY